LVRVDVDVDTDVMAGGMYTLVSVTVAVVVLQDVTASRVFV